MQQHEKNDPLIIKREDVFLPTKQITLTADPLVEQDVIVLFNQLLAGGVIRVDIARETHPELVDIMLPGICSSMIVIESLLEV
jgi:hypothetical protein